MSPSFRTARWIGLASVFVFVAAAAFGAKLWHKTPRDFFLSLATDSATVEPTLPEAAKDQSTGTAGSFARVSGAGGSTRLDGLPPLASGGGASFGALAREGGQGSSWTPWGSASGRRGLNGSSFSSGSASLGGLWHSMSPFGGHGGGAAATPATRSARAEPTARQAKPAPARSPKAGGSGGPPSVSAPSTSASAVPAGLGEHEAPLGEIGGGGGSSVGPIGGGGGGRGVAGPVEASANPEPGTIALVGTGLLGLIGAFRRRRA